MSNQKLQTLLGVLSFIVLTACIVFLVTKPRRTSTETGSLPDVTKNQQKEIKVFNKTSSFQLISTEISGSNVHFTFKNNYPKSINGFQLGNGKNSGAQVELIYSEVSTEIAPGKEYVHRELIKDDLYTEGLTVYAVLFTDGTGDGELAYIKEMQDRRRGEKQQFMEFLDWMQNSSQRIASSDLESIKLQVSSLKTKNERESPEFNAGLHHAKERLKHFLDEISSDETKGTSTINTEREIKELQSKLKQIVSKL